MKLSRIHPAVFAISAVAGLLLFSLLVQDISPGGSLAMRLSRGEIMSRATDYVEQQGFSVGSLHQDCWLGFEDRPQIFLQLKNGMNRANAMLRSDTIPDHNWYVNWYDRSVSRSQNREGFHAWLSPAGRVLGFEHVMQDSVGLASLTLDSARHVALDFLVRQHIDLQKYHLDNSALTHHPARIDHDFTWASNDTTVPTTLWVKVEGDRVGGFRETFNPPGWFQKVYSENETVATFLVIVSFATVFLLFFFIIILFLKKYHEGEVGTSTGILVFIGLFLLHAAYDINVFTAMGAGTFVADANSFNVRIIVFVLKLFIFDVFMSVLAFAGWSVGESSSRTVWPGKLTGVDSALFRKFFTVELGEGILRGYGFGLMLLGLHAAAQWMYLRAGFGLVIQQGPGTLSEAILPALQPLLEASTAAIFSEVVYRLFFISYIHEKTGRTWKGVVASVVLWAATGFAFWMQPLGNPGVWGTLIVLVLYGMAFAYLFLRYDLVTAMVANFVVSAFGRANALLLADGSTFLTHQIVFGVLMAVPVVVAIVGISRKKRFVFTAQTLPAHIQRISERERMAKELEIARNVQMSLLPKSNPHALGYDIAGICIPALEVGGDYYDFVNLGSKKIGIAIGDVSGKGVPAAIYMTLTKGILQSHAEDNVSPKQVLSKVNSLMYRTIERNSFVSMFYAILDVEQRTIRFARAGQCPVILTQREGSRGSFLTPKGMALGLENGKVFDSVLEEKEIPLNKGEVLVFYTDGFTEAMNVHAEEYGEDRLSEAVATYRKLPAQGIIEGICDDVRKFTGDTPQHDDMTMVVVKVS